MIRLPSMQCECIMSKCSYNLAATDTTITFLMWTFALLAENQEVQVKLQEELDQVAGRYDLKSFLFEIITPLRE